MTVWHCIDFAFALESLGTCWKFVQFAGNCLTVLNCFSLCDRQFLYLKVGQHLCTESVNSGKHLTVNQDRCDLGGSNPVS